MPPSPADNALVDAPPCVEVCFQHVRQGHLCAVFPVLILVHIFERAPEEDVRFPAHDGSFVPFSELVQPLMEGVVGLS